MTGVPLSPRAPAGGSDQGRDIRVMIVDDSAVIRGLVTRLLESDPDIRVVSSVGDGKMAVAALARTTVDVVVLDVEMPVMDGLTALPLMLAAAPGIKIIMASTLTTRNADISLRAMQAGAVDYVPKPTATREIHGADDFRRDLIGKIKVWARHRLRGANAAAPQRNAAREILPGASAAGGSKIALRQMPASFRPDVIAIGSSTGGPQALFEVMAHLKADGLPQPILLTQHMPPTFTAILAEHISRQCGVKAAEAKDGEPVVSGRCYVAPGDFHMIVEKQGAGRVIRLNKEPQENFCRPSVDPMMRSVVRAFGGRGVLAVILTGMGQDGLRGCREVATAEGVVVAQDEATSVVWGMPGAVASAGLCNAVLPLKEVGPFVRQCARRSAA